MPFIEIITDSKSQAQLNKVITKSMVNNCDILYIKDKNIENTKNIKLETLILNRNIDNSEIRRKILENSKKCYIKFRFKFEHRRKYENKYNFIWI